MTTAPTTPVVPPAPPATTRSRIATTVDGVILILGLYTSLSRLIFIASTFWTLHSTVGFAPDHIELAAYLYDNLPSFATFIAGLMSFGRGIRGLNNSALTMDNLGWKSILVNIKFFMAFMTILLSGLTVGSRAIFLPVNFWKFHAATPGWIPDAVGLAVNLWIHLPSVVALVGGVQGFQMSDWWVSSI